MFFSVFRNLRADSGERPYCDHSFTFLQCSPTVVDLATPWRMCIKPKGSLHLRGAPPMKSAKTWPRSVLGKRVSMVTADWRRKDESIESIMEAMRVDAVCRFVEPLSLREKVYSLGQTRAFLPQLLNLQRPLQRKSKTTAHGCGTSVVFWVCSLVSKTTAAWDPHVTRDRFFVKAT